MTAANYREQRNAIASQLHELVKTVGAEQRTMTAEEQERFDKLDADLVAHDQTIERLDRAEREQQRTREAAAEAATRHDWHASRQGKPTTQDYQSAFKAWSLGPFADKRQKESAQRCGIDVNHRILNLSMLGGHITRATSGPIVSGTTAANQSAGSTAAQINPLMPLEQTLKYYGGMRQVARIIRTGNGMPINYPIMDDTSDVAAIVAQGAALDVGTNDFRGVNIPTFQYSTKWIRASIAMGQDAGFDLAGWVGEALGIRMARGTNAHFTVGTGSGQPWGAITRASGVQATTGTVDSAINTTNLIGLVHAADPAYRINGSFMMHDTILKKVKALTDTQGRPLWLPGLVSGQPDTLLGYRYVVNNDMTTITTSQGRFIAFGDFSRHVVRDVTDMALYRADELFLNTGEIGWVGLSRHGSDTVAVSTANWPVWVLLGSTS